MNRKTYRQAMSVAGGLVLAAALSGTALAEHRHTSWGSASPLLRTDGVQVPGGCPIESPAGRFIFTARNPGTGLDIFVNQRASVDAPFETGAALPAPVNDANLANDFCPTPLPDNGLFFVSTRAGSCGAADMYSAVQNPANGWSEPVNRSLSRRPFHLG